MAGYWLIVTICAIWETQLRPWAGRFLFYSLSLTSSGFSFNKFCKRNFISQSQKVSKTLEHAYSTGSQAGTHDRRRHSGNTDAIFVSWTEQCFDSLQLTDQHLPYRSFSLLHHQGNQHEHGSRDSRWSCIGTREENREETQHRLERVFFFFQSPIRTQVCPQVPASVPQKHIHTLLFTH